MLQGKKTYILAAIAAVVTFVKYLGYIDDGMYQTLVGLLGAGAVATLRSSVNGIDKKLIIVFALLLSSLFSSEARAQAIPTSKIAWDQPAASATEAQTLTYRIYVDSSTTGIIVAATCGVGPTASDFTCTASLPTLTQGSHRIAVTAANILAESAQSLPLDFTIVVSPPSPPKNLRIIK